MRVAILGCGYVGLELCRQLVARGHEPVGIRRSAAGVEAVEAAGARAVQADVTAPATLERIPAVEAAVFAASAGGRDAAAARETYVRGLETTVDHFSQRSEPPEKLIYTSSTGVYGDHGGDWVDETTAIDPQNPRAEALAAAERVVRTAAPDRGIDGIVARVSGIYGPDRYRLERYLDRPVTRGYRNTIHRDDVAGAVAHLLTETDGGHDLVLVTDDEPVDRWAFADWLAEQVGVDPPPKRTVAERPAGADLSERASRRITTSKRCDNARLRSLGYDLRYPTYREGYREAIETYRAARE